MTKYIDADKLLLEAKELSGPMTGDGWDNWGVWSLIARQPAADVVKVVRCKDCRFCMAFKDKSDGFYGHCRIWITRTISDYAALVDADGYCSYGERKEG